MKKYADYDFYVNDYHGRMNISSFETAIIPASAYIKRATLGRSEQSDLEELKYAACAICDAYDSVYNCTDQYTGKNIKSENTDGYSVTYAQEFPDGTNKEEAFRIKASSLIKLYLSGVDLICAKVRVIR